MTIWKEYAVIPSFSHWCSPHDNLTQSWMSCKTPRPAHDRPLARQISLADTYVVSTQNHIVGKTRLQMYRKQLYSSVSGWMQGRVDLRSDAGSSRSQIGCRVQRIGKLNSGARIPRKDFPTKFQIANALLQAMRLRYTVTLFWKMWAQIRDDAQIGCCI